MFEIVEQKAYTNGTKTVAINQIVDMNKYTVYTQGYRIKKDGVTLFPAYKPFASYEEAEAKLAELTA